MEFNLLILAYDRPDALRALVKSIEHAEMRGPVNLWISCDKGAREEVLDYARNIEWEHGSYQMLEQERALGVDAHNLFAIQMAADMDHMLILEDDLILSPFVFYYLEACTGLKEDLRIAGISIYRYAFREVNHLPFELIPNQESVYYQQRPSSKGCLYTSDMARRFLEYQIVEHPDFDAYHLPANVHRWSNEIWEKLFYCFLIDSNSYVAFPRFGLSTDQGEEGVHMKRPIHRYIHQVPLYQSREFTILPFDETKNRYDAFYELVPEVLKELFPVIEKVDVELDLYGTKELGKIRTSHIISIRACSKPEKSWGRNWKPEIHNIIFNRPGTTYTLGKVDDFDPLPYQGSTVEDFYYYYPDTKLSRLIWLKCKEVWNRFF